ncbi:mannose-6-phosphate isomerase, class I [Floricoccus penangensis]|uniref:mannose-6-phosphate isomerase, class I n=1 Tax=Floricoccus penangensis TaxID=1859475 RepID=UPI00203C2769|nr:mannose-6-phosphate isomerase, class I [Floricoccus penangensis]URZ86962.1 mannose-6-phosphate isomerase, class I [Floricoccus penangensis]
MVQPLFLKPVLQEKIWGGKRLEEFGYDLLTDKIGELWAISGHPNGLSVVENGPFKGETLDELYINQPQLFGNPDDQVFPLLIKILDANEWLSVQVHPNDAYSLPEEGELGKTECWYIIDAEPGAEIIFGHTAQTKEELIQLVEEEKWDDLLTKVPVKKGDFFYVPSGTMHAIGPGVLVLETQQSSDITYRVYDFDRKDDQGNLRELHIKKALDVLTVPAKENQAQPQTSLYDDAKITELIKSDFFAVEKWQIHGDMAFAKKAPYTLATVIDGQGILTVDGQDFPIEKGQSFVLTDDISTWTISGQLEVVASTK